jgi:hypothetical protein
MKKITILLAFIAFVAYANAQRLATVNNVVIPKISSTNYVMQTKNVIDTLTAHFNINTPTTPTIYSDLGGGYVAGHDSYLDKAKAQKFDATYGVTAGGTISELMLWFGAKKQSAGTATVTPTIWADAAGVPGAVIGTGSAITVSSIDTSTGALLPIGDIAAPDAIYNASAVFSPAIAIPASHIFWAGITIVYASGDSVGLVTSRDNTPGDAPGTSGEFLDATTYTFEQWSDNSWNSFNDGTTATWGLDIALGVYPVVDLTVGINELEANNIKIYPNPATDYLLIKSEKNIQSVKMMNVLGEVIYSNVDQGNYLTINTNDFAQGVYVVQFVANGRTITKKVQIVK